MILFDFFLWKEVTLNVKQLKMIREAIQFEKSMNCLPKTKYLTEWQCYEDRRRK